MTLSEDHHSGIPAEAPDKAAAPTKAQMETVDVTLSMVLGETTMPIYQLMRMGRGAVIALDRKEGDSHLIRIDDMAIGIGSIEIDRDTILCRVSRFLPKAGRVINDLSRAGQPVSEPVSEEISADDPGGAGSIGAIEIDPEE